MSPDRLAQELVLQLAELCEPPEVLPGDVVDQCSAMAAELCDLLNHKRKPPICDLRAAIAHGYAVMLMRAIRGGDARMARLELAGIFDEILAAPTKT